MASPLLPPAAQGAECGRSGRRQPRHAVEPGVALAGQVGEEVGPQPSGNVNAQGVAQRGQQRAGALNKVHTWLRSSLKVEQGCG